VLSLRDLARRAGVSHAAPGPHVTHRAHFEVMFRPELYRPDDPELVRARDGARTMRYPPAAELADTPGGAGSPRVEPNARRLQLAGRAGLPLAGSDNGG
jgi:hypothetical protein